MKSKTTAYILWLFLGLLGAHKFYLDKFKMGILYMFTGGLFFVGWIVDLFTLGKQVDQHNKNPPKPIEWVKPVKEKKQSNQAKPDKNTDNDKTVFIEYEDVKGGFSDRTIEIQRVYKRGEKLYIDAYCYLADDDRTFLVDRILSMRETRKGPKITDIETYLHQLYKKPPPGPSAADLAALAQENDK
jgi:hypothetical protein